jgi:hypothetical protein
MQGVSRRIDNTMVERTGYVPLALGDVMAGRVSRLVDQGAASFDLQMDAAKAAPEPPPSATVGRRIVTAALLRQPDATGERMPTIPSNDLSVADYEDPIPLVSAELRKLGFDPSGIRFSLADDVISNPGGRYTNHLLQVEANGRREDYSVDLALRSPRITAVEILSLLGIRV